MAPPRCVPGPWISVVIYALSSTCGLVFAVKQALKESLSDEGPNAHLSSALSSYRSGDVAAGTELGHIVWMQMLKSPLNSFLFINFLSSVYALWAFITKVLFLGSLTSMESSKLTDRFVKYVVGKLVFIGAIIAPSYHEIGSWLTWFAVVGYLKMFVGLAKDRCEGLQSSTRATLQAHARTVLLLLLLLLSNILWPLSFLNTQSMRPSYVALCLFDSIVIGLEGLQALLKYGVNLVEKWREERAEAEGQPPKERWEWLGDFVYETDLIIDLTAGAITFIYYCMLLGLHGFSFRMVDAILLMDARAVAVAVRKRVQGHLRYLEATHSLHHLFPNATQPQMADAEECAICRDPLQAGKCLPCGHVFHLGCLRALLQQSGSPNVSCPICRAPLAPKSRTPPVPASAPFGSATFAYVSAPFRALWNARQDALGEQGGGPFLETLSESLEESMPESQQLPSTNTSFSWTRSTAGGGGEGGGSARLQRRWHLSGETGQAETSGPHSEGGVPEGAWGQQQVGSSGGSVAVSGAENGFWSRFQTPWREGLVQRFSRRAHGAGGSSEGSARGRGVRRWGMQLAEENGPSVQEQVRAVREVLPHLPDDVIVAELRRTPDINRAVERLMCFL